MVRPSLTLAALAAAAIPDLKIVGGGQLSRGLNGRFDSALLQTDAGDHLVIRRPTSDAAATEIAIEIIALGALSHGVRSRLPFAVPYVEGQTSTDNGRTVVFSYVPGYAVDAEHIPRGDGLASSIGSALAAIHSLPGAFVGESGLPSLTANESRNEARNVIERAIATRTLPTAVRSRWRDAVGDDELWQFHPTVINGGIDSSSFIITDHAIGPVVTGVLGWSNLRVGDPARDVHWLSAAGDAAEDVLAAYEQNCTRHPDDNLRKRAHLHAEIEIARWLLHGADVHDEKIIDDAITMLDDLVDSVLTKRAISISHDTGPIMAIDEVEEMLTRTPITQQHESTQENPEESAEHPVEEVFDEFDSKGSTKM